MCLAKKPDCDHCTLAPLCPSAFAPVQPKDPSPRANWNKKQQAARKGTAATVAAAKTKKANAKPNAKANVKPNVKANAKPNVKPTKSAARSAKKSAMRASSP